MNAARASGMEATLANGTILIAGGVSNTTVLSSAEIYTPAKSGTGTWTATGSLHAARQSAGAVSLIDGRVLVAGGKGTQNSILSTAELFDPAAGAWSTTGGMSKPRNGLIATLLYNGKVLVAGGTDTGKPVDPLASAELYDPSAGTWSPTGSMATGRAFASATLLPSGEVLVAGGVISPDGTLGKSAELYDPATGTWSSAGSMAAARDHQMAVLLIDGRVLIMGGQGSDGKPLATAELYTPSSNTWAPAASFSGGRTAAATDVNYSGRVLMAGGFGGNGNTILSSASVFTPNRNGGSWAATTALPDPRGHAMDVRLNNGKILVAGGWADDGSSISRDTAVIYLFDPNPTEIAPDFGTAGASFKLKGGGFTAGEQVVITWDQTTLKTVTAGPSGGFAVKIKVPADASVGGHILQSRGQTSRRLGARWFGVTA